MEYRHKYHLRIVPLKRCVDRMIKKNYYKENKSLGHAIDFELAFQGVENYLSKDINEIKSQNKDLFKYH